MYLGFELHGFDLRMFLGFSVGAAGFRLRIWASGVCVCVCGTVVPSESSVR